MATQKSSAKGKGAQKKKAAAKESGTPVGAISADAVAALTPLTAEAVETFNGTVHYQSIAAILFENSGGASPLIMYRPTGNYTPADIGAAASFLHHVLGKQEGDPVQVVGHRGPIFGQQFIFVISAS